MSHHSLPATTAGTEQRADITTSISTTTCFTMPGASPEGLLTSDENSPRPPVLGCEQEPTASGTSFSEVSKPEWMSSCSFTYNPRDYHIGNTQYADSSRVSLPGVSDRATSSNFPEIPSCLLWAKSLTHLLEDPTGSELFVDFLTEEKCKSNLNFWFACEGMKNQPNERAAKMMRVVYRTYIKYNPATAKHQTINLDERVRKKVIAKMEGFPKDPTYLDRHLFDEAQRSVMMYINENEYQMFLRSETYIRHVRAMQSRALGDGSEEECSSSSSSNGKELTAPMGLLPTLHEDSELQVAYRTDASLSLTKSHLRATQNERALESRPLPEASMYVQLKKAATSMTSMVPNPYHVPSRQSFLYSSYNPVSRQDSELQSLSSDAYTSDSASVTNSSADGSRYRSIKKQSKPINKEPFLDITIIPRTQRIPRENLKPMKPEEFFKILLAKLEIVAKERELEEQLDKKLFQGECGGEEMVTTSEHGDSKQLEETFEDSLLIGDKGMPSSALPSSAPADRLNSADDQSILDMHVSRIWPSITPVMVSPRASSPDSWRTATTLPMRGGLQSLQSPTPNSLPAFSAAAAQHHTKMYARHTRKDKDGVSTLSADSGNVRDYMDSSHRPFIPKSKSMPDCGGQQPVEPYATQGHASRMFSKESMTGKPSSTRRTLTDQSDSGVSVVSETPSCQTKDSRVMYWLLQNEAGQVIGNAGYSHSDSSSKHKSSRSGGASASNTQRQARTSKKSSGGTGSRSGSQERSSALLTSFKKGATWCDAPKQPFVADPSMPPIDNPHTPTQLEEARRRLEDNLKAEEARLKAKSIVRQRFGIALPGKSLPLSPSTEQSSGSGHSTLKKNPPPSSLVSTLSRAPSEYTTVVFTFCDEAVPYRTKITNKHLTLREFKELLPKKGTYRYFFKTECDDVDTKVVNEEVMDDNEIVPLMEGKVMAQVKPVE
ncbi:axin-1 isoform X2 [Cloeon dipterum]|uniref:axin-1 isoform X2 n=1 Tax=Cloeon dipterum TaxID=197152 RepID=UPI00322054EB